MNTAQDEQVDYSTFAITFGNDLLQFKELLAEEKQKRLGVVLIEDEKGRLVPKHPLETRQEMIEPVLDANATTAINMDISTTRL